MRGCEEITGGRRQLLKTAGAVVAGTVLVRASTAQAEVDDPLHRTLAAAPELLIAGALERDADGVIVAAPVTWPDGQPGIYTGTPSTDFPGATDAYAITYGDPVTRTYTQPAVTRDPESGAVTVRPPLVVT